MKITVQSSNSNPVATDDTNITTILVFLDSTGVWIIDNTGESADDLSVEVIATRVGIKKHYKHNNINYGNLHLVREKMLLTN